MNVGEEIINAEPRNNKIVCIRLCGMLHAFNGSSHLKKHLGTGAIGGLGGNGGQDGGVGGVGLGQLLRSQRMCSLPTRYNFLVSH
jgi:hypothetical protein